MKSTVWLSVGGLLTFALVLIAASPEKKSDPADAARLNNLGCAYMNQQLFEKGLKYFQEATAADPNFHIAKINQGIAQLALAHVDEAKTILEEVSKGSESQKNDPHVWYALGMLNKNSSDAQAAVDDFKRVIEIDDSDADTWYFLGTVYSQLKQFPQAIDAFDHALKLNPLHASAQFGLSRAYQQSGDSPHAREHLTRFQYITQNHLGSAMSLAYGEQGKYSLAEESPTAPIKVPPQIPVKFVDVTKEAGIVSKPGSENSGVNSYFGSGACFLDYDNDGNIDVLVANNGPQGGLALYHNLGNGKFEDATKKAGLNSEIHAIACSAGDYDNHGWTDIVVTREEDVLLFQNQKNGTFKQLEENLGAMGLNVGASFIDYDHDGDLDLVITRSGDKAEWGQMYRNNGNGTFTDVTEEVGFTDLGPSGGAGVIGTDYNNDRAIDILAYGFEGPNPGPTLLENPREGKFVARKVSSNPMNGTIRGAAVLDFDHDGWMDVAFTHQWNGENVSLWRNEKGKRFERIGFPNIEWKTAYGIAAYDYDNDGWVDLVAVGETKEGKGEIKLFRNLGSDGWKDVTADVGLDKIQLKDPRAIITGD
jgi:tetratricopeptide (TPR) repeat protein